MGRELPLDQLRSAWKSAVTARERRLVLLAGEAGIGKTRLAAAMAAEVAGDGARVLYGWCDDGVEIAYEAWVHALGGFVQSADEEEIAALAPLAPDLVRCISVVGERLPDVVARPTTDAASDRARLFDAVDSLLAQISGTSPLLLVLDDLHWADPATLGLLRWILSSERGGPMLVLGIYRDTDVDRRHPLSELLADLRRDPRVERVALRGLEEQAIGALLHDRAGHDAPPSSSPHCTTRPTGTRSSPRRSWPTSSRPARSSGATGYGPPTGRWPTSVFPRACVMSSGDGCHG